MQVAALKNVLRSREWSSLSPPIASALFHSSPVSLAKRSSNLGREVGARIPLVSLSPLSFVLSSLFARPRTGISLFSVGCCCGYFWRFTCGFFFYTLGYFFCLGRKIVAFCHHFFRTYVIIQDTNFHVFQCCLIHEDFFSMIESRKQLQG